MVERRTAPRRPPGRAATPLPAPPDGAAHASGTASTTTAEATGEDLLGTICHDLRDPLSAILMGTRFLVQRMPKAEVDEARAPLSPATVAQMRKMTEAIERAAVRMNHLVHDFQDLSRLERGRVTLDLQPVAAIALLTSAAEKAAGPVDVGAVDPGLVVRADRARVVRALGKLLDNALHAAGDDGRVTLSAAREGGCVRLAVTDTGPGIDSDVLAHVFDHAWLANRPARNGTGLGLAIARLVVDAHGGELTIETEARRGTTVSFTLEAEE